MPDHEPDMLRYSTPPRLKRTGIIVLAVAAVIVVVGLAARFLHDRKIEAWTDAQAVPTVQLIALKSSGAGGDFSLPGDVQAVTAAPIYARVSGYLRKWYIDIGTPVKAGQLLADLETPDLDGQVAQARADLATAIANAKFADATAKRWDALFAQGAVARQDKDQKDADLTAKNSMVASQRGNLAHLQAMEGFKRITAPFDGIVTSRAVDVGALVSVGTPTQTPLFTVSDQSRLRIYVRMPQSYSGLIRPGMTANFTVSEHPGRAFTATLTANAGAIVSQSGTQLLQFQIDNADGAIKPGAYAEMHFTRPEDSLMVRVPVTALVYRDNGMLVATVNRDNKVSLQPVRIVTDLGTEVDVGSGLAAGDRIIDNPPDSLRAGDEVRIAEKAKSE